MKFLYKEALMLAQEKTVRLVATPDEVTAIGALMTEPEAAVSDAPGPAMEGAGVLLGLLLGSPRPPKEPKHK